MALVPSAQYPSQTDSDAAYPQGKARNAGTFQDGTGTPLEKTWINDIWGFLQSLLAVAGITPSGTPDQVGASQYLDAVTYVAEAKIEGAALANWASQTSGTANLISGIAWNGTLFVAVGAAGTIITSPDGITWTTRTSGTANSLKGVTWSGALFVAVGAAGTIVTSSNGTAWTVRTSGTANALNGVAWNGTVFAAVGATGTIVTSSNGTAWTTRTSGTANNLNAAAWSGTLFAAVGDTGTMQTSPDGITWTTQTPVTAQSLFGVAWSGTLFAAVGGTGTILTSPDGITWTARVHPKGIGAGSVGAVFKTTRNLVAVGVWTIVSSDGITWRVGAASAAVLAAGAWDGQGAIVGGNAGTVLRSLRVLA